jgi:hypothetical protein
MSSDTNRNSRKTIDAMSLSLPLSTTTTGTISRIGMNDSSMDTFEQQHHSNTYKYTDTARFVFSEEKKDGYDDDCNVLPDSSKAQAHIRPTKTDDVAVASYSIDQEHDARIRITETYIEKGNENTSSTLSFNNDGNCLPSIDEIRPSGYHSVSSSTTTTGRSLDKKKRSFIVLSICIALCLTSIVMLLRKMTTSSSSYHSMDGNALFTSNYNRTVTYLLQHNISTEVALRTYGTPQYYAAYYIANSLQLSTPDTTLKIHQQEEEKQDDAATAAYHYVARYILALDYYHFTTNSDENQQTPYLSDPTQSPPLQVQITQLSNRTFMNFITSGMDVCHWNDRGPDNMTIQMGVTCSVATNLPIN